MARRTRTRALDRAHRTTARVDWTAPRVASRTMGVGHDPSQQLHTDATTTTTTTTATATAMPAAAMPAASLANAIADAFAPAVRAIEGSGTRGGDGTATRGTGTAGGLYVPDIPMFLCASRLVRDSSYVRSVLVHDERRPRTKPRLSWYDARDDAWVPRGWFADGIKADLEYYFRDDGAERGK